jgi:hypothetical protein
MLKISGRNGKKALDLTLLRYNDHKYNYIHTFTNDIHTHSQIHHKI